MARPVRDAAAFIDLDGFGHDFKADVVAEQNSNLQAGVSRTAQLGREWSQ